jgi:hypothetical protein
MKRIRIVALCAMALFALVAIGGTATASAASFNVCIAKKKGNYADAACSKLAEKKGVPAPGKGKFEKAEVGSCVAQKKGNYEDGACSKLAEKKGKPAPGHGKFEKVAAPGPATVAGGAAELKSAAGAITCTASTGVEQITGGKSLTAATTFTGCETLGQKCQNTATEGEIKTFQLHGVLVEPAAGKASINLTGEGKDGLGGPNEGKYLAEFGCTGVAAVRVHGGPLGGKITPVNTFSTTHTTSFEAGVEQGLIADFGPPGFGAGTKELPSEQIGSVTSTGASVDISAP